MPMRGFFFSVIDGVFVLDMLEGLHFNFDYNVLRSLLEIEPYLLQGGQRPRLPMFISRIGDFRSRKRKQLSSK